MKECEHAAFMNTNSLNSDLGLAQTSILVRANRFVCGAERA